MYSKQLLQYAELGGWRINMVAALNEVW